MSFTCYASIAVTPECFCRGSTVLTMILSCLSKGAGVQIRIPGFPLKACGNDGLAIGDYLPASSGMTHKTINVDCP